MRNHIIVVGPEKTAVFISYQSFWNWTFIGIWGILYVNCFIYRIMLIIQPPTSLYYNSCRVLQNMTMAGDSLKIFDFGFACNATTASEERVFNATLEYTSPELLEKFFPNLSKSKKCSNKRKRANPSGDMELLYASDMWSIGVVLVSFKFFFLHY